MSPEPGQVQTPRGDAERRRERFERALASGEPHRDLGLPALRLGARRAPGLRSGGRLMPIRKCLARHCPNRIKVEVGEKRSYCDEHHWLERQHQSSAHQRARAAAMVRSGGRCESCGRANTATAPLHLHHRGSLTDHADTVLLCRDCHTKADAARRDARRRV